MVNKRVREDALPNYDKAIIPAEKLRDYALNSDHQGDGRHKARVFKSMLGFERQHWEHLSNLIRARLPEYPALRKATTAYGEEWVVYIPVVGLNGNLAVVTTGWMFLRTDPDAPRLTTCLIQTERQKTLKRQLGIETGEP